jgi:hypothetical protein
MEKPNHDIPVKKLIFPDGFEVGINNLESILGEVFDLGLTDAADIKRELLERVRVSNYIAQGAEKEYSTALYDMYRRKFDTSGSLNDIVHKKHQPG